MQDNNYIFDNGGAKNSAPIITQPAAAENQSFTYKAKTNKRSKDKFLARSVVTTFINGILAGAVISIGAATYLRVDNQIHGSAIFAVGMFIVFFYGFNFYTNKVGYAINQNTHQNLLLIPSWLGNVVGALIVGNMITLTRDEVYDTIFKRSNQLCGHTLADTSAGIFILSVLCGIMMFIAADNFKNGKNNAQKFLMVFMCVMVFVLCRFEHSIVNVFYFTVADSWVDKSIWYIIIMTFGNTVGCLFIPLCHMVVNSMRGNAKNKI